MLDLSPRMETLKLMALRVCGTACTEIERRNSGESKNRSVRNLRRSLVGVGWKDDIQAFQFPSSTPSSPTIG